MRSVRLDDELEGRLEEAARISGVPVSEMIRDAVRRRCDEVLGNRLDVCLRDVIGCFAGGKRRTDSRRTGRAFTALLLKKHRRSKAR